MPVTAPNRRGPRPRTKTVVVIAETIPTVVLRLDRWEALCNAAGLTTPPAKAGFLDVTPKHIRAVEKGESLIGNYFIATALTAFGVEFSDLFTIEELAPAQQ